MRGGTSLPSDEILAAIAQSRLAGLPADLLERVTTDALRLDVPAGMTLVREGDRGQVADLVLQGLIRTYITAPSGRQITIRYSRTGSLLGIATLFVPATESLGLQALVDSRILVLRPAILQALARSDVHVACALLGETSDRAMAYIEELGGHAFASLRQRLVRHLLDLATVEADQARNEMVVARVSQQELADAAGTVREVVVRMLRDLRREGLVETGRDGIILLDPARLHAATWSRSR